MPLRTIMLRKHSRRNAAHDDVAHILWRHKALLHHPVPQASKHAREQGPVRAAEHQLRYVLCGGARGRQRPQVASFVWGGLLQKLDRHTRPQRNVAMAAATRPTEHDLPNRMQPGVCVGAFECQLHPRARRRHRGKMPCNRAHTASRPPPLPEATSCQVPDILEQLPTNRSNNSGAPPVSPAAVRTGAMVLPNVKHPLSAASQSSIKPSDRKTFWNPVKRDEPWTIVASLATHDEWRNSEQQSQRPTLTVRHSSS